MAEELIGRVGRLVHGVRGGELAGEVRIVVDGLAHYYLAYAATAIPTGAQVLVINNRGARRVDVELWLPTEGF